MPKYVGVLERHSSTGAISVNGKKISGRVRVRNVNGAFLKAIEWDAPLTYTGTYKERGQIKTGTLSLHVLATHVLTQGVEGIDLSVTVGDTDAFVRQQKAMKLLREKLVR